MALIKGRVSNCLTKNLTALPVIKLLTSTPTVRIDINVRAIPRPGIYKSGPIFML